MKLTALTVASAISLSIMMIFIFLGETTSVCVYSDNDFLEFVLLALLLIIAFAFAEVITKGGTGEMFLDLILAFSISLLISFLKDFKHGEPLTTALWMGIPILVMSIFSTFHSVKVTKKIAKKFN